MENSKFPRIFLITEIFHDQSIDRAPNRRELSFFATFVVFPSKNHVHVLLMIEWKQSKKSKAYLDDQKTPKVHSQE